MSCLCPVYAGEFYHFHRVSLVRGIFAENVMGTQRGAGRRAGASTEKTRLSLRVNVGIVGIMQG
jgi:hypothetical protein